MNKKNKEKIFAIITAGGTGIRFSAKQKKQYVNLNGYPVLFYSLKMLSSIRKPYFKKIVLTVPEKDIKKVYKNIIEKYNLKKIFVCAGGKTRHHSVYNGILCLKDYNPDIVYIHDGVRPLITKKMITDLYNELIKYKLNGIIPVVRLNDTVKKISSSGYIEKTLKRDELVAVQTPQVFKYNLLLNAYQKNLKRLDCFTDDASILEKIGIKIKTMSGDIRNIKITTLSDLKLAEYYLSIK